MIMQISHKMFIKTDYVELYSGKKVNFYHHKKQVRDEKYHKKQRMVAFLIFRPNSSGLKTSTRKQKMKKVSICSVISKRPNTRIKGRSWPKIFAPKTQERNRIVNSIWSQKSSKRKFLT